MFIRDLLVNVLTGVGALYMAKLLWGFVSIFYRYTVYQTDWKAKWGAVAGSGRWAVVTGASDGIGREYALQLARKGYSVLLVGRSADKLKEVAGEIAGTGGSSEVLIVDFSSASAADYGRVKSAIAGKEVRVLVNNVGVGYPFPEYLHLQTDETLDNLLTVNIKSMIEMTRIVVPGMLNVFKQTRGRSLVYNVGSFSYLGAPLLGAYAGSKGFVFSFSESLLSDYQALGVDVRHFHPLFIATKLAKVRNATLFTPSPRKYAETSLRAMNDKSGNGAGGYLFHDLAYFVFALLPRFVLQNSGLRMHKGLRSRAYVKFNMQDPLKAK